MLKTDGCMLTSMDIFKVRDDCGGESCRNQMNRPMEPKSIKF